MRSSLPSLLFSLLALAAAGTTWSCNGDSCSDSACPSAPYQPLIVTFPCGRPAPATLTTSGACTLGTPENGAPTLTFVPDGTCHVSATFADGTTAEADVTRTTTPQCCGGDVHYDDYSYSGLTEGVYDELQLGGPPCADGGFGTGYED